ncbi:NAD(P)-binding protein, partial [Aureobasidium melanogenum]
MRTLKRSRNQRGPYQSALTRQPLCYSKTRHSVKASAHQASQPTQPYHRNDKSANPTKPYHQSPSFCGSTIDISRSSSVDGLRFSVTPEPDRESDRQTFAAPRTARNAICEAPNSLHLVNNCFDGQDRRGCTVCSVFAPISKGGFEPPLTAKSAEGEDQTTQPERHEQQPPKGLTIVRWVFSVVINGFPTLLYEKDMECEESDVTLGKLVRSFVTPIFRDYLICYLTLCLLKVQSNVRNFVSRRLNNVGNKLASVGTREQSEPSLGDIFKGSGNDGLVGIADLDLAGDSSITELLDHLRPTSTSVKDDQALDDGNATESLDAGEHQVENLTTNVVEVDINVAFGVLDQLLLEVGILVVDADIGAQALNPLTLVCSAGDTNDALAANNLLGDLDDHAASGTGSTRDNDNVVLGGVDVLETVVGSDTGQTEGAEEVGLLDTRDGLDLADVGSTEGGVNDSVFAPVGQAVDERALGEVGGLGLDDCGDTEGGHGCIELDGREVHALTIPIS